MGIGPQYNGDSFFTARMRFHQSWYRANVLRLPYGVRPTRNAENYYGNMLTSDDGDSGRNFLTPEIAQVARERVAQGHGTIEPFRLFHNMLSSQPMCFNLFGPLVKDYELATRFIGSLVPESVKEVTRVAIEWAPEPANDYLGDRTAFDAFIEYCTTEGRLCALGVETKLTEPFSPKEYDGERYRRWMRLPESVWRSNADANVNSIQHNQLWRDHLLAFALCHHPNSQYAKTYLMLVRHPEDQECACVLEGYRQLLHVDDDSLIDMPLDNLVKFWEAIVENDSHREWLNKFRLRYLDLERSSGFNCRE